MECEGCNFNRTRQIEFMGHSLTVKNYICARDGGEYEEKPKELKLQLSICPTDYCGGSCFFCVANTNSKDLSKAHRIDLKRLEKTLEMMKEAEIVRGISITGGEPFTDVGLLNEIVNMCFDIFGSYTEIAINTNGSGLKQLDRIEMLSHVDALHISRHHYEDVRNHSIFNTAVPTKEELKEIIGGISYKDIFVFNCLLLKDYIGNTEEAYKYMEFAHELEVPKVAFITPMPVNDFVRSQQVRYDEVIARGKKDSRFLVTREYRDFEYCRCHDGIYLSDSGDMVEFYGRETKPGPGDYVRGFVIDCENNLRTGHGGKIIC